MKGTESIESTPTTDEQREGDMRLTSPSRLAAAIEAAYILEAVRK